MIITKSVLNMVAYSIVLVLILLMGLALLKAKGDNADSLVSAEKLAQTNKIRLDEIENAVEEKVDTAVSAKMAQLNRSFEEKLSLLRAQDIKHQQQLIDLQRKIDAPAQSQKGLTWVVNPETRHSYALIPFALPWHAAKAFAESEKGHLVVINDKGENEWLVQTFGADTEYWAGLTDEAEEGKWKAVNGEPVEYFNWAPGEPDNYRKNQHYVMINAKAPHLNHTAAGRWNDVPANEPRIGIIERPF